MPSTARTALAHRTRPTTLTRRIVGTPTEVAAALAVLRESGRLMFADRPHQHADGRVTVTVRFLDTARTTPPPVRRLRRGRVIAATAITTAAVGALAGIGYLATQVAHTVQRNAPAVVGVALVLIVLAVLLLRRKVTCGGLHCSGCQH
ncbi:MULTISPECIES: hypothetical protein [unclassified Micromonospora]|uniref:hypothetical protein n=1 Tax=unclassified Micromonospora TaxID=2617518 RepID=UPI001C245594|nr:MULTISPECIES: hypothetical protein [unclassified Micromonospora]MBU8857984.1 hypothetical protein [Micromonospora sp. WMMB482]MDM4783615.1 hypothetical protein [Micromonospora sp. b486]